MLCQVGQFASSKSAHERRGAAIERVDHHLAIVGPVISTRRSSMSFGCGAIAPFFFSCFPRLGQEIRQAPPSKTFWRAARRGEQLAAARLELPVQLRDKSESFRRENRGELGARAPETAMPSLR